jgi:hypothetical protein
MYLLISVVHEYVHCGQTYTRAVVVFYVEMASVLEPTSRTGYVTTAKNHELLFVG